MAESVVWVGCIIFFLTALISFLFSWLLSHISLVDRPVARSSHAKPTPTAGGIAFVAGLGVGAFILAFSSFLSPDDRLQLSKLLGLGLCVAAFGLWDDLVTPGAFFKLIFMAILSLVTVWVFSPVTVFPLTQTFSLSLPVTIGFLGSALWIFTVMNTVNFIDGANGMLGGSLGLASLGLAGFCAWDGAFVPMITALGLTAVVLGFLPWNLREKACLFAGDTGALLLGFLFAGASLIWSANTGKGQIYIVVFLLLVLLLDVGLTLIWRLKKGLPLLQAHRDHHYQLLIRTGWTHRRVSALYAGLTLGSALLATLAMCFGSPALIAGLIFLIISFGILSHILRKRAQKNLSDSS